MTQVRLGPITGEIADPSLTDEEFRLLGRWRRWADAVVVTPTRAILYEAALIPSPADIGVLLLYRELFPHTPELEELAARPVTARLLWSMDSPVLRALAARLGLETVIFHPPWLVGYLRDVRRREARPARPRETITGL